MHLNVPKEKLDEYSNISNPLYEVIGYWFRGNIKDKPVNWKTIVDTLREVENPALANDIESTYCKTERGN